MSSGQTAGERLVALLEELGIERTNVAVGPMAERQLHELAQLQPSAVASITYVLPEEIEQSEDSAVRRNIAGVFAADPRPAQAQIRDLLRNDRRARVVDLPDRYAAEIGSDFISDNPEIIIDAITGTAAEGLEHLRLGSSSGSVAGVSYHIQGSGPPLLLFPAGFAPSQWDAVSDTLGEHFTLIRLGGPHLGVVQLLESRASNPGYVWGVRAVLARLEIRPGEQILEVGAGSGALARDLAHQTGGLNPIVAVDINAHFVAEAQRLAQDETVDHIEFRTGNAEQLPFNDGTFDVVFTSTVLEECDADEAMREIHRVLKPGGRAAVIVRGIDLPRYWHLDIDPALTQQLMRPMGRYGPVSSQGIADASLYDRFARIFDGATPCPFWAVMTPPTPWGATLAAKMLEPSDARALEQAVEAGSPQAFQAQPHHAVVGVKGRQ